MAEIYDELDNKRRANALRKKAAILFKKFNEVFWDEESGFYAFALDGEKKKVLSVASNVGQCLWSGIIAPDRARTVVKRLMRKDMWSGWGIRTLSADHPSFNPYNYQTGAVWPHDNSLIAMGMRRYGFAVEAAAVARDISGAASHFLLNQLPELYGGLQRDPTNFPVQYSVSWRQRAAGLGRRDAIYAAAGNAGAAAGRAARQAVRRSSAAGLAT
jgi:glycogen debranching enzyme